MAESVAQNYFEQFTGADAARVLSGLPDTNPKTFEDNWLDFKSGKTQPDDLAGVWSKALGAMANAGGGVVVWGVIAKKHGTPPVDAAASLAFVPDVNAFASRLIEVARFGTDPPLDGVRVNPIPIGEGVEGFVVCLIPEGRAKPYQSLKAKKPFYLRMGDESKEPPLAILRQLFNPQRTHRIKVTVSPSKKQFHGTTTIGLQARGREDHTRAIVDVTLENIGSNTVEEMAVKFECSNSTLLELEWLPTEKRMDAEFLKSIVNFRIFHPLVKKELTLIVASVEKQESYVWKFTVFGKDMIPKNGSLIYKNESVTVSLRDITTEPDGWI